jgi:hypothetical protein
MPSSYNVRHFHYSVDFQCDYISSFVKYMCQGGHHCKGVFYEA